MSSPLRGIWAKELVIGITALPNGVRKDIQGHLASPESLGALEPLGKADVLKFRVGAKDHEPGRPIRRKSISFYITQAQAIIIFNVISRLFLSSS
jgi:hypothetical protein